MSPENNNDRSGGSDDRLITLRDLLPEMGSIDLLEIPRRHLVPEILRKPGVIKRVLASVHLADPVVETKENGRMQWSEYRELQETDERWKASLSGIGRRPFFTTTRGRMITAGGGLAAAAALGIGAWAISSDSGGDGSATQDSFGEAKATSTRTLGNLPSFELTIEAFLDQAQTQTSESDYTNTPTPEIETPTSVSTFTSAPEQTPAPSQTPPPEPTVCETPQPSATPDFATDGIITNTGELSQQAMNSILDLAVDGEQDGVIPVEIDSNGNVTRGSLEAIFEGAGATSGDISSYLQFYKERKSEMVEVVDARQGKAKLTEYGMNAGSLIARYERRPIEPTAREVIDEAQCTEDHTIEGIDCLVEKTANEFCDSDSTLAFSDTTISTRGVVAVDTVSQSAGSGVLAVNASSGEFVAAGVSGGHARGETIRPDTEQSSTSLDIEVDADADAEAEAEAEAEAIFKPKEKVFSTNNSGSILWKSVGFETNGFPAYGPACGITQFNVVKISEDDEEEDEQKEPANLGYRR